MNRVREAIERVLRGPQATSFLRTAGIDPRRYWLLMDLFRKLSERAELSDQLGRNKAALKYGAIFYFLFATFIGLAMAMSDMPAIAFLGIFLAMTVFLLSSLLIMEAANSLVNPTEAMVMAHQPIDGATYSAAKLSHLLRIVLYLVPGINIAPAFEGLFLKSAPWYYPAVHLAAALGVGLITALFCCAVIGWLIRFIPLRRLKGAAQIAGAFPMFFFMLQSSLRSALNSSPAQRLWSFVMRPEIRWPAVSLGVLVAIGSIAFGLRALTADYLIRSASLVKGGTSAGSRRRWSGFGAIARILSGSQPGFAGFAFVSRMVRRDYQFRRQMIPTLIFPLISLAGLFKSGWPTDPFIRQFSYVHLLPHVMGLVLFFVCFLLRFGNDHKGGWVFLLVPSKAIDRFAQGVHAYLWLFVVLVPGALVIPVFAWRWGPWHAVFFALWTMAAGSMYLAVELQLVQSIPFTRQMDTGAQGFTMFLMMGWGIVAAAAVALQYFVIFRSVPLTVAVTVAVSAGAFIVTRASLQSLGASMRFHLNEASQNTGTLYKEIAV